MHTWKTDGSFSWQTWQDFFLQYKLISGWVFTLKQETLSSRLWLRLSAAPQSHPEWVPRWPLILLVDLLLSAAFSAHLAWISLVWLNLLPANHVLSGSALFFLYVPPEHHRPLPALHSVVDFVWALVHMYKDAYKVVSPPSSGQRILPTSNQTLMHATCGLTMKLLHYMPIKVKNIAFFFLLLSCINQTCHATWGFCKKLIFCDQKKSFFFFSLS